MFRSLKPAMIVLAATLSFAACEPVAQNTPQSIRAEAGQAQQLVRQLQQQNALVQDPQLNAYVSGIVRQIEATRPPGAVPIQSYIIKDADVNAFTPGGGYLFVNAGLIAAMENEAQLATVLAHEIGHIDRGHIQAQRSRQQGVGLGAAAAAIGGALLGVPAELTEFGVNLGAQYAVSSFTREQERDADLVAARYLARANYDVVAGAQSFDVLRRISGGAGGPAFLSTHPPTSERQQALIQAAAQAGTVGGRVAEPEYDAATRGLRQEALAYYQRAGRQREASVVAANLAN